MQAATRPFFVRNFMTNMRNIAVIAHVDHGKTTLVDALLKQTNVFRQNQLEMQQERLMDKNELERERGITIMAKNCAIEYKDTKINIIDTPGHADFSGEVERTLSMADGALLIIDAQEGPMPQTRFVLKKALELNLKIIVVVNKIDKVLANVEDTINKVSDLFLELAAHEDQLDFTTLYAVGRAGTVFAQKPADPNQEGSVVPLLDAILAHIPAPQTQQDAPFKMVISSLDYDEHLGQIVIGKVHQGSLSASQKVTVLNTPGKSYTIERVMGWQGMQRVNIDTALAGDIVALTGIADAKIGTTIGVSGSGEPLPSPAVGEPTLHMTLGPNTSPFSGKEAEYGTSRQLEERLNRELQNNVSLRVEKLDSGKFKVSGRGELHLAVLLETMRREGYEMEVGKPEVITKEIDEEKQEPVEEVDIMVPQEFVGTINQEFGKRFGNLVRLSPLATGETEFIYHIPTRAIIGLRSLLLTLTKGTVIFNSQVIGYQPVGQPLPKLRKGVLISAETGKAVEYGLRALKGRGSSFVNPGTMVYEGMIVGQNSKDEDIEMNVCKEKNLTNHRSKSHQGITQLAPDVDLSLEQAIDFLENDELLEITPRSLRLRKKFLTDIERRRALNPHGR